MLKLRFASCALLLAAALPGQPAASSGVFRGELTGAAIGEAGDLFVEIRPMFADASSARGAVQPDGRIEVSGLKPGWYVVSVRTKAGDILREDVAAVGPNAPVHMIELPNHTEKRPGGVVSVAELSHPPSKRAVEAVLKAERLSAAGRHAEAASGLEKLLPSAPEFGAAHNALGVQYVFLGRFEDAAAQFEAAVRLSPGAAVFANLAVALSHCGQATEAEAAARRGVGLDRDNAKAHLALGLLLAEKATAREEAIHELSLAAKSEPSALLVMAGIYKRAGESEEAQEALDAYHRQQH
jgi:hypothetical protein